MFCRIIGALNNVSNVARYIIKIGVSLATLLMLYAIFCTINPLRSLEQLYYSEEISKAAVVIFAEVVIFGLLGESLVLKKQNQD